MNDFKSVRSAPIDWICYAINELIQIRITKREETETVREIRPTLYRRTVQIHFLVRKYINSVSDTSHAHTKCKCWQSQRCFVCSKWMGKASQCSEAECVLWSATCIDDLELYWVKPSAWKIRSRISENCGGGGGGRKKWKEIGKE
jgi:hypothetical protein